MMLKSLGEMLISCCHRKYKYIYKKDYFLHYISEHREKHFYFCGLDLGCHIIKLLAEFFYAGAFKYVCVLTTGKQGECCVTSYLLSGLKTCLHSSTMLKTKNCHTRKLSYINVKPKFRLWFFNVLCRKWSVPEPFDVWRSAGFLELLV